MKDSNRLKILFVPSWYPSIYDKNDTVGTFCREHARAAALYDDVAVLISTRSRPRWYPMEWKRVTDNGVQTFNTYCGGDQMPRFLWPIWQVFLGVAIRRLIREWGIPDVIHTQDDIAYHVIHACRSLNIPFVMSQHASCFGQKQVSSIKLIQYRYAFERVKRVLTPNPFAHHDYEYYGLKPRTTLLPNVIDLALFYPPATGCRNSWILHASNLAFVKRFPDVLHAFKKVLKIRPTAILQVAGDGANRIEMEQFARTLLPQKSYIFHGRVSKLDLANLMRLSMGFILPSGFETFGCVLIEALACECPVLTTSVGGIPAIVPRGNGIIVEVGNVEQIANGMLQLLDGTHGIEMRRVGHEIRDRFKHQRIGKMLHEIHFDVVSQH